MTDNRLEEIHVWVAEVKAMAPDYVEAMRPALERIGYLLSLLDARPAVAADARELVEQWWKSMPRGAIRNVTYPQWDDLAQRITTYANQRGDERWREGMKQGAKEVCDACENSARYGPAQKIEGSTRYWHVAEGQQYPCEAGGIWHALNHPADKVDG